MHVLNRLRITPDLWLFIVGSTGKSVQDKYTTKALKYADSFSLGPLPAPRRTAPGREL